MNKDKNYWNLIYGIFYGSFSLAYPYLYFKGIFDTKDFFSIIFFIGGGILTSLISVLFSIGYLKAWFNNLNKLKTKKILPIILSIGLNLFFAWNLYKQHQEIEVLKIDALTKNNIFKRSINDLQTRNNELNYELEKFKDEEKNRLQLKRKIIRYETYRVGAICYDGTRSYSTGRGTCSHHGGVDYWLTEKVPIFSN